MSKVKLAFVGGEENTLCFRGMGFDVFVVKENLELREMLQEIRSANYAIIFTEWRFYPALKAFFEDLRSEALPVICPIPTRRAEIGKGADTIKKLVELAIGSKILLQGEE